MRDTMQNVCDVCKSETQIPEAYYRKPVSFRLKSRTYCPSCWAQRQKSAGKQRLYYEAGLVVLGIILVASGISAPGYLCLNLFLIDLSAVAAILPHELGHAVAGRLLGMRVFKVVVGTGKTLYKGRLLGFDTEFKLLPFGGATLVGHKRLQYARLRQFLNVLAGPAVNAVLCVCVLPLATGLRDWDFSQWTSRLMPAEAFLLVNALVVVTNLIPRKFQGVLGPMASDGLWLFRLPFMKSKDIEKLHIAYYVGEASLCQESGRLGQAESLVEEGLKQYPEDPSLLSWRGILRIESLEFGTARDCFHKVLDYEDDSAIPYQQLVHYMTLNNIAYVDALMGDSDLMIEADDYSRKAMEGLPWMPPIKGTRGTVLVQLGQVEAGVKLLHEAMETSDNDRSKAQNACFIAMAEAGRGDLAKAKQFLQTGRQLNPACFLLERAEQAIQGKSSPATT